MCGCKTVKYNDEANLLLELFLQMCCQSAIVVKRIKVAFPLYKEKKHIKIFIKKYWCILGISFIAGISTVFLLAILLIILQHGVTATDNLKYKIHFTLEQNLCNFKLQNSFRCLFEK